MSTKYTIAFVADLDTDDADEQAAVRVAAIDPINALKDALEKIKGIGSVALDKKMKGERAARGTRKPRTPKLAEAAD